MNKFLLVCLSLLSCITSFAQGGVRRVDTLTDLLTLDPRAFAAGTKLSYEVGGRTSVGDWGQPRTAIWYANGISATNNFFVFNGVYGQWWFNDSQEGYIKPEWGLNFTSGNATAAILEATRLSSTNKYVWFTAPMYDSDGITINASVTARMDWRGSGTIGASENGQFGDANVIRLRAGSNTNFLTIDGNVSFNIEGLMFNANKANQANTFPAVHVKGTTTYYSGVFRDVHVNYSKGDGFYNDSRPQVYFLDSGSAFNNGSGVRLNNTVDNIINNMTVGKNMDDGLVVSNFTTVRITKLDSYENLGNGMQLIGNSGFSTWAYIKDCVVNVNGKDGIKLVGNIGLSTLDNILFDRANADKVTGFWTNAAASGTYSFITSYTNSAGAYPRDMNASNLRLGYFETGSTLKPAYFIADYTGRKLTDWKFNNLTFVYSGTGSPAVGDVNFNVDELKMSKTVRFSSNLVHTSQEAINRLTVGADVLNTNYPLVIVGKTMIQEKAVPANQWVIDPDTTSGAIVFKDGVDGDPFMAMRRSGTFETWAAGAMRLRSQSTGVQLLDGSNLQFETTSAGAFATNGLGINTHIPSGFKLAIKGYTSYRSLDGLDYHSWIMSADAGAVAGLFGIQYSMTGDPAFYMSSNGLIQLDASRGLRIPVRTGAQEAAISSPNDGSILFNSTLGRPRYAAGGSWSDFGVSLEDIQDNLGTSFLVAGSGISLSYNDGANTLTIANTSPGTTVNVNGSSVSAPNFKNSATVTWSVVGSDVTATANGATNAAKIYVDTLPINEPNLADSSEINFSATGTNISAALISGSVAYSKIQNVTASRLLGRDNSGTGSPQELSVVGATFSGSTLTIDPQESTNVLINGTKVIKANWQNSASIGMSVAGSTITPSLTDGDKGDITLTGSGTTFTIDNGAVTYAKIQNVSASKLLGRRSGSGGSVEEISLGSGLSMSSGGVLSVSGAGSGVSKFGTIEFTLNRHPGDLWLADSITSSGNISALVNVTVPNVTTDYAFCTIYFSSAAASANYHISVELQDNNASTQRETITWSVEPGTKTVNGFQIRTMQSDGLYLPPDGVTYRIWVLE